MLLGAGVGHFWGDAPAFCGGSNTVKCKVLTGLDCLTVFSIYLDDLSSPYGL